MGNWSASASSSSAKLRRLLGTAVTGFLGLVAEEMDLNWGFDDVVVEPLVVGVLVLLSLSSSSSASSPPRRRKLRALLLIVRCRSCGGFFLPPSFCAGGRAELSCVRWQFGSGSVVSLIELVVGLWAIDYAGLILCRFGIQTDQFCVF